MSMNPHVLAGAKALQRSDSMDRTWDEEGADWQRVYCAEAEAVIRSLPNGEGILSGSHAVLPVEATEEMADAKPIDGPTLRDAIEAAEGGVANTSHYRKLRQAQWRAMVRAHLKAEKAD